MLRPLPAALAVKRHLPPTGAVKAAQYCFDLFRGFDPAASNQLSCLERNLVAPSSMLLQRKNDREPSKNRAAKAKDTAKVLRKKCLREEST